MQRLPVCLLVLVGLGAIVRALSLAGDLWLDEIISVNAAQSMVPGNFAEVLRWHHDNNHPLNTFWLSWFGTSSEPWQLRALSFVSGVGSLLLIVTWPLQGGIWERTVLCVLWSFSYLLCLYDSEARGYAPMLFFGLLGWRTVLRWQVKREWWCVLAFNLCLLLSSLAHVSGVYWSIFAALVLLLRRDFKSTVLDELVLLAGVIGHLWYFDAFVRFLPEGSGTLRPILEVLLSTLSLMAGGPEFSAHAPAIGAIGLLVAAAVFVVLGWALVQMLKEEILPTIPWVVGIFILPAAVILLLEPRVLYERYFLVPLVLSYFVVAKQAGRIAGVSKGARLGVGLLLCLFIFGNGLAISRLVADGRGSYKQALLDMKAAAPEHALSVAFDHGFRGETVAAFYQKKVPELQGLIRISRVQDAQWYVVSSQEFGFIPAPEIHTEGDAPFLLRKKYPATPLSGFNWFVYERTRTSAVWK